MTVIVRGTISLCTLGQVNELISIEPGEYEIERIKNPFDVPDADWYVFKELNAGASVKYLSEKSLFSIVKEDL